MNILYSNILLHVCSLLLNFEEHAVTSLRDSLSEALLIKVFWNSQIHTKSIFRDGRWPLNAFDYVSGKSNSYKVFVLWLRGGKYL